MKIFKLVKGKVIYHVLVGKTDATLRREVDGNWDTSVEVLTSLEGNRRVNQLIREGYETKK